MTREEDTCSHCKYVAYQNESEKTGMYCTYLYRQDGRFLVVYSYDYCGWFRRQGK